MWTQTVFLLCANVILGYCNDNSSSIQECHRGSEEKCGSSSIWTPTQLQSKSTSINQGSTTADTDYANHIINDVYFKLKEAEINLVHPKSYPPHYQPEDGEEFDFIIVGAGSAGSVMANRLSEVGSWRVLLVEAGGNPTKSSEIPGLAVSMQGTDVDWNYQTEPEENKNCLGMVDGRCKWPRGKMLGGSSTMNYMMYVRGNRRDYDNWESMGNTGWSYDDILPLFKKSEDMRSPAIWKMKDAEKYHSKGGYLKIEPWTYSETSPLMETFGEGYADIGYPFNPDYNGRNQSGFFRFYGTLENRRRCSSAKAFLSPITGRKNIKVSKNSLVTKVLIDKNSDTAYGVELLSSDGQVIKIRTRKEVVLSAGALNTPQILMLSGVGPKQHLETLGVPLIHDLPVGRNLQDHPLMNTLVISVNVTIPKFNPVQSMVEFLSTGSGELTNVRAKTYSAFISTVDKDYPDVQFLHLHVAKNDSQTINNFFSSFGVRSALIDEFKRVNENKDSVFILGSLMRPFSRGEISLKSIDPTENPRIVSGMLSDQRDVDTFQRVYDLLERLVQTKAMKSIDAKLHEVRLPGCEKHPFRSREYRECSLRHLTATTYHYCGTCKMGPSSDPEAVVDPSLRVFGVKGLRVADASVMPTIVSGNINAAVVMIGEKAADLIKKDWL